MSIKFPEIKVKLTGTNGNAFAVLGKTIKSLKSGGATPSEVQNFQSEATSGDYDHLLGTVMNWVNVS